jgi:hypothetical protein
MMILLISLMEPVVENLSNVCKNYLAMKKENKRLAAELAEFLTNQTTCATVLSKRTTSEIICQKGPLLSGGTSGQATRSTCRLGRRRHGAAASRVAGMWSSR